MAQPFVKDVRDLAMTLVNETDRKTLRDVADALDKAITKLFAAGTRDALEHVNGLWALAQRAIDLARKPVDNGPTGGSLPLTAEQRAA